MVVNVVANFTIFSKCKTCNGWENERKKRGGKKKGKRKDRFNYINNDREMRREEDGK